VLGVGFAILVALVVGLGPDWIISDTALKTTTATALLLFPLCVMLAVAKAKGATAGQVTFAVALLLWWFLLLSDQWFDRASDADNLYQAQYSVDAYGEVVTWLIVFLILALISIAKPDYLGKLGRGSYKWVALFVTSSLVACAYSPSRSYSAGWWCKLFVVALVLALCTNCMEKISQIRAFLWSTMWGLLLVCMLAVGSALADPTTLFAGIEGRLNADPVVLSGTASCLLIVSLILNSLHARLWLKLISLFAVVTTIISFGKTGIVAGAVSASIFFLLQKKLASSLLVLVGVGALAAVLVATITPLGNYFATYHGGAKLSGRTEIWKTALPAIKQKPIVGHGYLASKFMFKEQRGADVASHLHNGFLDTLYNNGAIGLGLLLALHGTILGNLYRARKRLSAWTGKETDDFRQANVLLMGGFALYLDLLIYGCFTPAFGGRTTDHFMVFLSIVGLSMALERFACGLEKPRVVVRAPKVWRRGFSIPSPRST
jgi:O-antigen ligase